MLIVRESDCRDYDVHRDILTSDDIGNDTPTSVAWETTPKDEAAEDDKMYWRLNNLRDVMLEELKVIESNYPYRGAEEKRREIREIEAEICALMAQKGW